MVDERLGNRAHSEALVLPVDHRMVSACALVSTGSCALIEPIDGHR